MMYESSCTRIRTTLSEFIDASIECAQQESETLLKCVTSSSSKQTPMKGTVTCLAVTQPLPDFNVFITLEDHAHT
jgi:hypothetical protein